MQEISDKIISNSKVQELYHKEYFQAFMRNESEEIQIQLLEKILKTSNLNETYITQALSFYISKGLYRHIHRLYKKIQNYKVFQENQKLKTQLLTCYYFAVSYYSLQHEIQQVKNELNQIPGINMQQINAIQVNILESRQIKDNLVSQLHQYISEKIPKQGEYFIHENMAVYLLPMSWYKKWLKFSQNCLRIQEEQDEERQDLFGKPVKKHKKSLQQESDDDDKFIEEEIEEEEEEQGDNFPGYLDPYLLCENQDNLLIDPLPEQSYTNYVLKSNICENKDFLFVTPFVAKNILDLFEGFMIQRFTYLANREKQQVKIETNLLKINLIILPVQSRNQDYENVPVHTIQISHQQNIQQLKEKIKRCLEILPLYDKNILEKQFRLYKLDSSLMYDKLIQDYLRRKLNKKVDIRAQKLNDQCKIEDSQICEQDLILVEFKTDEHYLFNPIENEDTLSNKNINQSANLMLTNNNQVAQACQCCGKEEQDDQKLPIKCSCTYVKYCSSKCQDQDKSKHAKIHKEAKQGFEQISKIIDIFSIQINPQKNKLVKNRAGLVGLKNLGNTCFMNSSIQCLSNCFELTKKFLDGSFIQDFNPVNPLGTKCFLAGSYYEILVNLWQGKDRCFQPWNFKKIVGNYAPQFSGYSQQDAQELLSYLLDGLHEDLNRVKIKPFVEQIESDGRNDNKVAIQSWNNYLKRNQSLIVDNIVGQYKSTLICPTCNKISVTFDPFMSISLPIPPPIPMTEFKFYFISLNPKNTPKQVKINIESQKTLYDLKQLLVQIDPQVNIKSLISLYMHQNKVDSYAKDSDTIEKIWDNSVNLFIQESQNSNFDLIPKNENNLYRIQLYIYNSDGEDLISFVRFLHYPQSYTLKDLKIYIYKKFRHYLNNYQLTQNQPILKIDVENDDQKTIIEEYNQMCKLQYKPYKLQYLDVGKNQFVSFNFDDKVRLDKIFSQKDQDIQINLILDKSLGNIKSSDFKFNTCSKYELDYKTGRSSNIYDCIDLFIKEEILEKGNEWYCNKCKEHKNAQKKMELQKLPKYLILQFKRFKTGQISNWGRFYFTKGEEKIKEFIDFPINKLDLTKYVIQSQITNEKCEYDLVGVTNHSGGISSGHYTAYCYNEIQKGWFDYNDMIVSPIENKNIIVSNQAYVLFYKRRQ